MIDMLHGDCRELLDTLADQSVQCICTSPPYWGLRKYSDDPREIGGESTPGAYVAALADVFARCWRVLRDDGTLFLNLGDAYANDTKWGGHTSGKHAGGLQGTTYIGRNRTQTGLPSKSLIGLPWRVAFALQDAGWILRCDIIWEKPNCMPESVTDRPTRSHEYVFLFAKRARYFYDAAAIREDGTVPTAAAGGWQGRYLTGLSSHGNGETSRGNGMGYAEPGKRNARSVFKIPTQPLAEQHYAAMPEALVERYILAGSAAQACPACGAAWRRVVERETSAAQRTGGEKTQSGIYNSKERPGGFYPDAPRDLGFAPGCACPDNDGSARSVILDPFAGSGTVLRVAERFQRSAIGIDLGYQELQQKRTDKVQVEMFANGGAS